MIPVHDLGMGSQSYEDPYIEVFSHGSTLFTLQNTKWLPKTPTTHAISYLDDLLNFTL
jgi:hypothetical protein